MSNRDEVIIKKTEKIRIALDFSKLVDADDDFNRSTFAVLIEQALTFTSKILGLLGNVNTVEILNPGVLQASSVFTLVGNKIVITLQHDGTLITATPSSVVADFAAAPSSVTDLVALTGASAALMLASIEKSLTGGIDETVITCVDVSELVPIDAISKLTNLPVTIDIENIVELFFANGKENHTYRIDVLNTTNKGSRVNKSFYVSIIG